MFKLSYNFQESLNSPLVSKVLNTPRHHARKNNNSDYEQPEILKSTSDADTSDDWKVIVNTAGGMSVGGGIVSPGRGAPRLRVRRGLSHYLNRIIQRPFCYGGNETHLPIRLNSNH